MKKILTIVLAGTLVAGIMATALGQGAGPKGGAPGGQRGGGPGGPGGPGGGQRRGMGALLEKIQPPLTADQKKKIEAIAKKFRDEMQKLRGGPGGGPGGPGGPPKGGPPAGGPGGPGGPGGRAGGPPPNFEKFRALMEKRNAEVRKVLNKQQQASYDKLIKEMMQRFQNRGGAGRPGGPGGAGGGKAGGKTGGKGG